MNIEKPQIAVFSLAYNPFEGGAEIAAREIIKRLKTLNFAIFTYKFDRDWLDREQDENADIVRVGGGISSKKYGRIIDKIIYIFQAWRAAEKMHSQKRFRVIWAVMASYGGIAALFFKLRHPNIPMLLTIQEGDCERHLVFGKLGMVGFFGKKILREADYIQVISNYLKDFVLKRGAKCPIEIVPNGVDLDLFAKTEYDDIEFKLVRNQLGLKDEYVIVTTSRLVYKNGIDILIRAVGKLKEKRRLKCLIIGDGPERVRLDKIVEESDLISEVIFLGQIRQRDLPLYLKISDVFVRPSRSEGLGNSFLEAMAAGVPIVGTMVGGIKDFLVDGVTGFSVKSEDPEDLAEKIDYVLKNSGLRGKVINNAARLVQKNYSWDRVAADFKVMFDKLVNVKL